MQRITITIDEQLAQELDDLVAARGYQNRSEAVRDLVRAGIVHTDAEAKSKDCIACLSYVFDPSTRELPKRLARHFQRHHDMCMATMDRERVMEGCVLKGQAKVVQRFAEEVIGERGVRHGRLSLLPASIEVTRHAHGDGHAHAHQHVKV